VRGQVFWTTRSKVVFSVDSRGDRLEGGEWRTGRIDDAYVRRK
jgi:hypothetical protein